MKGHGDTDRLRQLAVAFQKMALHTPELRVDPPALRALPASPSRVRPMFRVRLRNASGKAQARMYVHGQGAKVETRVVNGAGEPKLDTQDELPIDLRRGYRWEAAEFEDAGEMAQVLYKHIAQQLNAAAGNAA